MVRSGAKKAWKIEMCGHAARFTRWSSRPRSHDAQPRHLIARVVVRSKVFPLFAQRMWLTPSWECFVDAP
jgi:hypothetical protein